MIRAVVFDFDGLILDTEGPVYTAWQEAFAAHGCPPLTIEQWAAEIGTAGAGDMGGMLRAGATRPINLHGLHEARRHRRRRLPALRGARAPGRAYPGRGRGRDRAPPAGSGPPAP